jgi:hypothetical protein
MRSLRQFQRLRRGKLFGLRHASGPEETPCPDWDLVEDDDWFPVGAAYVDEELVLTQAHFLKTCERNIEIMIHPSFTGRCPECGNEFDRLQPPPAHWDCDRCGWMNQLDLR